ncbi:hypothetical protein PPL_06263 [Heterostelium album PN500]|uniref:DDE Tnp4 domain-containing protein n=1 Tax=Heterostelium pallidum (strain ATCC 26659 / Pp 5 / PN500) TaxID=670386 RepID=D3BCN7_HETP5|nr:hypothetical protein PPL_06263 [Heterostelium album PN500]EFA80679.1 hypothetical protein PPL_06263 [Heterostelium album PN500]|eukprot:XP_020432799.1 hypothetical protein PPL_06263 [Heterostelium album PN500]
MKRKQTSTTKIFDFLISGLMDGVKEVLNQCFEKVDYLSYHFGFKYEFTCSIQKGEIIWWSGPYPRSQADIDIARYEEGILSSEILQYKERFIGDKAYQGERESFKAMIKKPRGGTLTPLEKEFNAFLSSKRIIIENELINV